MQKEINIGLYIRDELRRQGRSVVWLARQLNTNRMACYRMFHGNSIDTKLLLRISIILDKNFFELYCQCFEENRSAETSLQ